MSMTGRISRPVGKSVTYLALFMSTDSNRGVGIVVDEQPQALAIPSSPGVPRSPRMPSQGSELHKLVKADFVGLRPNRYERRLKNTAAEKTPTT